MAHFSFQSEDLGSSCDGDNLLLGSYSTPHQTTLIKHFWIIFQPRIVLRINAHRCICFWGGDGNPMVNHEQKSLLVT
jgi:hypothetical protein